MLHKERVYFIYSSAGCMEGFYEDREAKWTGFSGTVNWAASRHWRCSAGFLTVTLRKHVVKHGCLITHRDVCQPMFVEIVTKEDDRALTQFIIIKHAAQIMMQQD